MSHEDREARSDVAGQRGRRGELALIRLAGIGVGVGLYLV